MCTTEKYQDYVIKEGKLIGRFEEMYQKFEDPWNQSTTETFATEKALAIHHLKCLKPKTIVELGCGFGHFTDQIRENTGSQVIGLDLSETAIAKAKIRFPKTQFLQAKFEDFALLEKLQPDALVMAEITWYILDQLPQFLEFMKRRLPDSYLLHLLNVYPPGEQKYGNDYFFDLQSILRFFDMNYLEFGEVSKPLHGKSKRTFFTGRYSPLDESYQL